MSLLRTVSEHFAMRRVAFATVGGVALAIRGIARSTFDVDLFTMDAAVLADPFWALVVRDGPAVEIRRGDQDDPLRGLVRLTARDERPVDVVVGRGSWQEGVVKRAEPYAFLDVKVPVVRAADLVLLKLHAGGTQDLWDVRQLLDADRDGEVAFEVESHLGEAPKAAVIAWRRVRAA